MTRIRPKPTQAQPLDGNRNEIVTDGFSNPISEAAYFSDYRQEPRLRILPAQCFQCRFYVELNADYGLCGNKLSRHWLETMFEHAKCMSFKAAKVEEAGDG